MRLNKLFFDSIICEIYYIYYYDSACQSEKFKIYNKYKLKWLKQIPSCDCEMCVNNSDERIIGYYFICG